MKKKVFIPVIIIILVVAAISSLIVAFTTKKTYDNVQKANKGTIEASAYSYVSAVERSSSLYLLENSGADIEGTYKVNKDGSLTGDNIDLSLDTKGTTAVSGTVILSKEGNVLATHNLVIKDCIFNYNSQDGKMECTEK